MIKNGYFFSIALVLLFMCMMLTVPFPNTLHIERGISVVNVLIKTENGYQREGVLTLLLLFVSLYFLVKAVRNYRILWGISALILFIFVPSILVNAYQHTYATGIAAISYDVEKSDCQFEMVDDFTLKGSCRLPLQNLSSDEVTFNIEFYESYWYEDAVRMVSLMNEDAPYEVTLKGNEKKWVRVEALIDVTEIVNHIEKGTVSGVHIIIDGGVDKRKL